MNGNATSQPLVSVVIPTYNRPAYLREAIASALRQSYVNIEILVRDNASTDETRKVVQAFPDPRIRYHRHPANVGPTENVIGGCREARGVFVAHLHDDDVWEPDFLEKLVPPLQQDPAEWSDVLPSGSTGGQCCSMPPDRSFTPPQLEPLGRRHG